MRRLHPPTIVLISVGLFLTGFSLQSRITDCAYTPDGSLRWPHIDEWMVKPDYKREPYSRAAPTCDVWSGIKPRHPLGTIELEERTQALGPIIARIEPDGSGFVAIFSPVIGAKEKLEETPEFASIDDLREVAKVLEFASDPNTRSEVERLLAPMRSFASLHWLTEDEEAVSDLSEIDRKMLQIDDAALAKIECRREVGIMPWLGEQVTYGSTEEGGSPRYFLLSECGDVADQAFRYRRARAFELLVEAAGAQKAIESEILEKYPECQSKGTLCYQGIL